MKKVIGYIDVDAGIVQVGDPCYTLSRNTHRSGVGQMFLPDLHELAEMARKVDSARVDELLAKSHETIHKMASHGSPGVDYDEMINRLIDHDDVQLKISHAQIKAIHEHSADNPYHPREYNWDEPVLTSLSPAPEMRGDLRVEWQAAYNPYATTPEMQGKPHAGAGLVISSGWGDGSYAVEVEWDDEGELSPAVPPVTHEHNGHTVVIDRGRPATLFHRIKSVKVIFIEDEPDQEE